MTQPEFFALYEFCTDAWQYNPVGYFWTKEDAETARSTCDSADYTDHPPYVEQIEITGTSAQTEEIISNSHRVFVTSVVSTGQFLAVNSTEQLARAFCELEYGVSPDLWCRYDFAKSSLYGYDRQGDRLVIENIEVD